MRKKTIFLCLMLMLSFVFTMPMLASAEEVNVTVSMEKFTLGQGYVVEPQQVTVADGTKVSQVITDILGKGNYANTGSVENSFYLARIKENVSNEKINMPKYIVDVISQQADVMGNRVVPQWLGEFDYNGTAGWMVCVNNKFLGSSSSDYPLHNGDVIRWQFTVSGLGADIGAGFSENQFYITVANKDALTAKVAEANKKNTPAIKNSNAYKSAVNILENLEATQSAVDIALTNLQTYLTNNTDTQGITANTMVTYPLTANSAIYQYNPKYVKIIGVSLNKKELSVKIDESEKLIATFSPLNATAETVTWKSDNENIAKVSNIGRVKGISVGTTNVRITTLDGGFSETCKVTVNKKDVPPVINPPVVDPPVVEHPVEPPIDPSIPPVDTSVKMENMKDVKPGDWFYNDVAYCLAKGIFKGTSATTFGAQEAMTRAQFVTTLGRYNGVVDSSATNPGTSTFADVDNNAYYAAHVTWAVKKDIVQGMGDNKFSADATITREDMATMMLRYANAMKIALPAISADKFVDDGNISEYAKDAVYTMKAAKVINGKEGNIFDPKGSTLRSEVAAVLHRFLEIK
ncbi:MAG: S-layer homology domain-containing protein [Clostridiales bacterium]